MGRIDGAQEGRQSMNDTLLLSADCGARLGGRVFAFFIIKAHPISPNPSVLSSPHFSTTCSPLILSMSWIPRLLAFILPNTVSLTVKVDISARAVGLDVEAQTRFQGKSSCMCFC